MLFRSPSAAHRWLRTTFAHRAWLLDELADVHELGAFPRAMARELARLGGYGPPPGEPYTP